MSAVVIDGKAVAATVEAEVAADVAARVAQGHRPPSLHVVLCGDDPASVTYIRSKGRACERVGISSITHTPAAESTTDGLLALLDRLNADEAVDAILVQLPLPPQIDVDRILTGVARHKDVDGFHPANFGMLAQGRDVIAPCTPRGCVELLHRHGVPVRGARAVVIGRSVIVGRPVAMLLLNGDATVTTCHSRTPNLAGICREADIIIAAVGRPGLVDASFVRPGAAVIDVGITRVEGKLRGDVDFDSVLPVAGYLTPVPGGVGPMTIAMLLRNTVTLARAGERSRTVSER